MHFNVEVGRKGTSDDSMLVTLRDGPLPPQGAVLLDAAKVRWRVVAIHGVEVEVATVPRRHDPGLPSGGFLRLAVVRNATAA